MSDVIACPPLESWQQHLDGDLPTPLESEMTAHLSGCPSCQKTVETLAAGGDTLLKVAGQVGEEPPGAEPALRGILEKVPNPFEETQDDKKGRAEVDLSFLQPATEPGHLGRLGHYAILELVGRGGFGLVFRAFDEKLRRIVAIKVLAPELSANASARQRFTREARAVAAVRNEHVIAIFEVQDAHQPPYFAMEFVEGQSLQAKLDRVGPLGTIEILRIGMQMAEGLAAAHKQGLIHRDVKPANVLLENGVQRVKITDFGLARAADDSTMTHSGAIAGTPAYMSPEQAHGDAIDARSDLFSLGSVLYAMAAGHAPFRASTTVGALLRVAEKEAKPLRKINPDVPEWLVDIIAKLHAKKPEERFQSAREIGDCLGAWLAHMQQPSTTPRPVESKKAAPRKSEKRSWGGRIVLLIAALLFLPPFIFACLAWLYFATGRAHVAPAARHKVALPAERQGKGDEKAKAKPEEKEFAAVIIERHVAAGDVLNRLAGVSGSWETEVDHLLALPGESRSSKGTTHTSRVADGRYLRLRTYCLPQSPDKLQFLEWPNKSGDFQSWLFDSNGGDFSPLKGRVVAESKKLLLQTTPANSGPIATLTFSTTSASRVDCELRVSYPDLRLTTGLNWRMFDKWGEVTLPQGQRPPIPVVPQEPDIPLCKEQSRLILFADESLFDVVNKATPAQPKADRTIVQMNWTKSLGGMMMEGRLRDKVSGESSYLLAYFDVREKVYRLWTLPENGDPYRAAGVMENDGMAVQWKATLPNGNRTELHWKREGDRCHWTMKKMDNAGVLLHDSEWSSRGPAFPDEKENQKAIEPPP